MSYRGDEDARRLRVEKLEAELGEARREIAELRAQGAVGGLQAAPATAAARARPGGARGGAALGVGLIVLGPLIALLVRAPPAMAAAPVLVIMGVSLLVLRRLVHLAPPSEALVVAGRRTRLPDGSTSAFHVQAGGRVLRLPLVETVQSLDLRVMPAELRLRNAYCRDGAAVEIAGTALVRIASDEARLRRSAERFLGAAPEKIVAVAAQSVEGWLRETVADLSVEQLDEDRSQLAERAASAAADDLDKLGLQLVGLWLFELRDQEGRLAAARKKAMAEAMRRAEVERREQAMAEEPRRTERERSDASKRGSR